MGMKGILNESPMPIRNAVSSPKRKANVGIRGQVSMQKGDATEHAMPIKGAVSKPKAK